MSDPKKRSGIQHTLRDTEKQAAERELPALKEDLLALFGWVPDKLLEGSDQTLEYTLDQLAGGCDHTLKYLEFAARHNIESGVLVQWLNKFHGYCDCEVVANVPDVCPAFS
jgi:hypothetical protein